MLQRKDEIYLSVNATKVKRNIKDAISWDKSIHRVIVCAKWYENGKSAAELRIEEGSTTMYGVPEMVKI